jgi:hypothetical protein
MVVRVTRLTVAHCAAKPQHPSVGKVQKGIKNPRGADAQPKRIRFPECMQCRSIVCCRSDNLVILLHIDIAVKSCRQNLVISFD